jgi:hypothetical protein
LHEDARGRFEDAHVTNGAVHRVIEQQAAMQPLAPAVAAGALTLTYRELNQRANTLARGLAERGLRRGAAAMVSMERGADLAVVLLAVLKAGAAYCWIEPGSNHAPLEPFRVLSGDLPGRGPGVPLDIHAALEEAARRATPNLPILTRGSDIACVLPDRHAEPRVLVPHGTIASLAAPGRGGPWTSEPGAFDLWVALMSGATLTLREPPADASAAA